MTAPLDLCPHGDVAAACVDCLTGKPPERPAPKPLRIFEAKYPGRCDRCRDPIEPGEEIALMDDGETYEHAEHHRYRGRR
jgi:hypothetical protein